MTPGSETQNVKEGTNGRRIFGILLLFEFDLLCFKALVATGDIKSKSPTFDDQRQHQRLKLKSINAAVTTPRFSIPTKQQTNRCNSCVDCRRLHDCALDAAEDGGRVVAVRVCSFQN